MENIYKIIKGVTYPINIVDIGVRGGVDKRWIRLSEKYPINVIGFDADKEECEKLNKNAKQNETFLPFAVFSEKGRKFFYITKSPGNYSFLEPIHEYISRFEPRQSYEVIKTIDLETNTLDEIFKIKNISDIDFLKIDTEGAELEVLKGANETLKTVFAIETEVWFNALNKDAVLFYNMDLFLRNNGFQLFDLSRNDFIKRVEWASLGGPKGQLFSGDALYMRDLVNEKSSIFKTKEKLLKCILISLAYCYYDYALEILNYNEKIFDVKELLNIKNLVVRNGKRIGGFKGRYKFSNIVKYLARILSIQEIDYLGNW